MTDQVDATMVETPSHDTALAERAQQWARGLVWLPAVDESTYFEERLKRLTRNLDAVLAAVDARVSSEPSVSEDLHWLDDNLRLIRAVQRELQEATNALRRVPHVRTPDKTIMPRVIAAASGFAPLG